MKKREPSLSRALTKLKKKAIEFSSAKGDMAGLLQSKCEFEVVVSEFSAGGYQVMDRDNDYNPKYANTGIEIENFIKRVKKLKKGEKLKTLWD